MGRGSVASRAVPGLRLLAAAAAVALGAWLAPAGFDATPFAVMPPSMLAMRIFSFTAYVLAYVLLARSMEKDRLAIWHGLDAARRALALRVLAAALALALVLRLAAHRDLGGLGWG